LNDEINKEQSAEPEIEIIDESAEPGADEQLKQEREKYLRLAAEYDNFRKRSKAERDSFYGEVKAETVKAFLDVYDALELALKQECTDAAYKQGVELTKKKLDSVFEKLGVTPIAADAGTPFDPVYHNALMHVEDDTLEQNVIAEELMKGFILGEKVIRHSMVKAAN